MSGPRLPSTREARAPRSAPVRPLSPAAHSPVDDGGSGATLAVPSTPGTPEQTRAVFAASGRAQGARHLRTRWPALVAVVDLTDRGLRSLRS